MYLLVCVRVIRERFNMEDYIGDDDVFALVKEGSFRFRRDGLEVVVNAEEGVYFEKGIHYNRYVINPVTVFLFRFRADSKLFPAGKIIFRD